MAKKRVVYRKLHVTEGRLCVVHVRFPATYLTLRVLFSVARSFYVVRSLIMLRKKTRLCAICNEWRANENWPIRENITYCQEHWHGDPFTRCYSNLVWSGVTYFWKKMSVQYSRRIGTRREYEIGSTTKRLFLNGLRSSLDCFTSHVGEHRTVRGLCKFREIPEFLKYPQCNSPRKRKRLLFTSRWRRSSRWRRQGIPRVYLDTSQLDWRVIIGRTSANQSVF